MTSADPATLADHELESRRYRMALSGTDSLTDDKGRMWTWRDIVTEQADRAAWARR